MANEQNLKPIRTKSEARERGRNGGIASGKARREKKNLRDTLQMLIDLPAKPGEIDELQSAEDFKKANLTLGDQMALAMVNKARKGDIQAFVCVRDTLGEKPTDQLQIEQSPDIKKASEQIQEIIEDCKRQDAERDRIISEECSQSTIDKLKAIR